MGGAASTDPALAGGLAGEMGVPGCGKTARVKGRQRAFWDFALGDRAHPPGEPAAAAADARAASGAPPAS